MLFERVYQVSTVLGIILVCTGVLISSDYIRYASLSVI